MQQIWRDGGHVASCDLPGGALPEVHVAHRDVVIFLAWVITSLLLDLCCDGGHRIVQPLSTTSFLCWPLPRKRMSVEHLVTCQNLVGQVQRFAPLSVTQNFVHLSTRDRQRTAAHDARYLFLLLPLLVTRAPSIPGAQVFQLASEHMAELDPTPECCRPKDDNDIVELVLGAVEARPQHFQNCGVSRRPAR